MRWSFVVNILLVTVNILYGQTYIVKLKEAASDSSAVRSFIQKSLDKTKSRIVRPITFTIAPLAPYSTLTKTSFPWHQYYVIRFSQAQSPQLIESIAALSTVEYFHPSYTYRTYSVPNDSAYLSQWNLRRIGISSLWLDGTFNTSMPEVKVGVIDTGIDDGHPDLVNTIALNPGETGGGKESNGIDDDGNGFVDDWRGYDFVDGESEDAGDWNLRDNDPRDENGHGTAVSGIIGAQSNNSIGLTGIMPAKILPLRAFGKNGNGTDIDIASAVVYAADNGADVINMSFGDVVQSPMLHDAIKYAYSKNIILVASSGNDGSNNPHYPSDFNDVISTGSVGQHDVRSFFSSYSPSLDLMAPGEQIVTATMGGGYTDQFSGTSAAAPHVSGVAALIKSMEREKIISNPAYKELSNEEIRGVLLNSADDAGENGWDKYYGAGIVNASKAIQSVSGSIVTIHSPKLDEIITGNTVPVIISALTPYVQTVQLYYGAGEDPKDWIQLRTIDNKIFIRDTIINWDISSLMVNCYQLRLVVKNSKGNDIEFRQRIVLNASNPKILSFIFRDSVIVGNEYGALVEAQVDRKSSGTLHYRKVGEVQYKTVSSLGLQMNHSFLIQAKDFSPLNKYEFYCLFTENSTAQRTVRFPTTVLTGFDQFQVTMSSRTIATEGFVKKGYTLPKGFLLNQIQTITGKQNVLLNMYSNNNDFGKLAAFEFNGNNFSIIDSSKNFLVPRSFTKDPITGKPAILVQDRGISQLLQVDTISKKYFSNPVWGDSSDVWASQLCDLDGDNKSEIIARSSTEFLIYRNLGNNGFSLVTRLPNPSIPLSGDARNQFGPPRSIIGDFTNTGRKEIIFADYDGDVIMYRQLAPNSLNFVLAGIDSSYLYEMSDYITSGDFNGDGISDFAVAGHSNLDWNQDREYDVPVWTVKVFSHLPADGAGKVSKIWEQSFVGVKGGSGYDNGLMSGRLKKNDTKDVLCISFNPQLYIFEWNASRNTFESKWMHSSQSNGVIVYDFDGDSINDIGFHTNDKTEFWSLPGNSIVQTPFGVTAIPVDSTVIALRWSSSSVNHKVYRGTNGNVLNFISSISGNEWVDSTVSAGIKYYYSVSSVNGGESSPSEIVSVISHAAPVITSVIQASLFQLSVGLSFDVAADDLLRANFILDSVMLSSSVVWESSRRLLISFPTALSAGSHTIKIQQLTDASGMKGNSAKIFPFVTTGVQEKPFFVRSATLAVANKIRIEFSEQMDFATAKNVANYTVRTIARPFVITSVDSIQPQVVVLNLSSGANLSELSLRIEIRAGENIISSSGAQLNSGKGQVISIAQETQSIDHIAVYPNPVKNSQQVSFVNIPADCRITIYSPQGEKIKVFEEKTTSEGISWNLRNEQGILVSTGIYLYRVEQLNSTNEVQNSKLGKFAVIR